MDHNHREADEAHVEYVDDDDHGTDPEQGEAVRVDPDESEELRPRGPIMAVLHGYRVAANWFAGVVGVISAFLIFPTVIISVVNVVLRRVGANQGRNLTSNSLVEAQWYLYTLIFVFGLAHILRDSINVRVDFWFGNRSSRTQSWIDLVGHMIGLLPFAFIGIKYSWPAVSQSWQFREKSPNAGGLPLYPIKTALMFAFVFLMIQGIAELIKNIEYLRGHEYRHESDNPALAGGQTYSPDDFAIDPFAMTVGVTDERRGT
ncbi:MAG: TRAP transporter small permease subunit [Ilumatobacteraceae bacterium]